MIALSILILVSFLCSAYGNVMGVDLGSDSMKIAIVQPGSPLEIVTNLQSKRKTPTCLAFYKEERLFGSDAYALMGRKPDVSLAKFNRLIGRTVEHTRAKELKKQYFPYELSSLNDSSVHFAVENVTYSAEELLAMLLQHAKQLTFNHGGKVIKGSLVFSIILSYDIIWKIRRLCDNDSIVIYST